MRKIVRTNYDNLERLIAEVESEQNSSKDLQELWWEFRQEIHQCVNVKQNTEDHIIYFDIEETTYTIKVSEFHRNGQLCQGELGTTTIYQNSKPLFTIHYNAVKNNTVKRNGIEFHKGKRTKI